MDSLPTEILLHIVSFLEVRCVARCSMINKMWYEIINTDCIWKKFCHEKEYLREYQYEKNVGCRLQPECYWKWYYINYSRISDNWVKKNFNNYQIKTDQSVGFLKIAAYDGSTLVLAFAAQVKVYKVKQGNVYDIQRLNVAKGMLLVISSVNTNTAYVVLNSGKVIAVYRLVNDLYEDVGLFYKQPSQSTLQCVRLESYSYDKEIPISFYNDDICCISSVLSAQVLYMYVGKKLYTWSLQRMAILTVMEADSFLTAHDRNNFYICTDHHTIDCYDEKSSQKLLSLEIDWNIHQIETNQNIILAIEDKDFTMDESSHSYIAVWDKYSGEKLYVTRIEVPDHCFLHPKFDIMFGSAQFGNCICSFKLKDYSVQWVRFTNLENNPSRDMHSLRYRKMAADQFIMAKIGWLECYHLVDWKTGLSLYNFDKTEVKFVGFDLLVLADPFSKNIELRMYS